MATEDSTKTVAAMLPGYKFTETPSEILAKYANEPPSLELHIHPTHYRFSNQEGIIPRSNPMMIEFLSGAAEGVILPAATEVFRDSGIRFYEGCVILKIVDYRNVSSTTKELNDAKHELKQEFPSEKDTPAEQASPASASTPASTSAAGTSSKDSEPPSHRMLLHPTPLTFWHDLLYTTDASQGRFSDQLALSMESEILNLTVRTLDLRVPPKSYRVASELDDKLDREKVTKYFKVHKKLPQPKYRITLPRVPRKLHEDLQHQSSSAYDDFMLILEDQNVNQAAANVSNQFMRLAFIEQLKKKRQAAQSAPTDNRSPGQVPGRRPFANGNGTSGTPVGGNSPQQGPANLRYGQGVNGPSMNHQQQVLDMRARQNQMRNRISQAQAQIPGQGQGQAPGMVGRSPNPGNLSMNQAQQQAQAQAQAQGRPMPTPQQMQMINRAAQAQRHVQAQAAGQVPGGMPQGNQRGMPQMTQQQQRQMQMAMNMQMPGTPQSPSHTQMPHAQNIRRS